MPSHCLDSVIPGLSGIQLLNLLDIQYSGTKLGNYNPVDIVSLSQEHLRVLGVDSAEFCVGYSTIRVETGLLLYKYYKDLPSVS